MTKRELQAEARRLVSEAVPFREWRAQMEVHALDGDGPTGFHHLGLDRDWGGYLMTWPEALASVYPGAIMEVNCHRRISRVGEEPDYELMDVVTVRLPS